jgi:hypothetical protein
MLFDFVLGVKRKLGAAFFLFLKPTKKAYRN